MKNDPSSTTSPFEAPEVSLVMPCYNEQDCLWNTARALLQAFANHGIAVELILVDNGSTDRTGDIIQELVEEGQPVVKVSLPVNRGYGNGILEGMKRCRAPFLGYLCADGQVSAEDTVRIYKLVQGTDGRILAKVRRRFRQDGLVRKITSIAYNGLMLLVFGRLEAIDLNGSPKIFSREAYRWMHLRSKDWFLDPEIMLKARALDLAILELNVRGRQRQGGKTNVQVATALEFLKNILRYRLRGVGSELRKGKPKSAPRPQPIDDVDPTVESINRQSEPGDQLHGLLGKVRVLEQPRLEDARGYLQKILTSAQCDGAPPTGEVYVTCALTGEAKGNHFHRRMGEWFAVVEGNAVLELCDPDSGQRHGIPFGSSRPRSVYVPPGVAHALVNTGNQAALCVAWAEKDYDAADIFPFPVWPPLGGEAE